MNLADFQSALAAQDHVPMRNEVAVASSIRMFTFSMGTREVFAIPVESVAEVSTAPDLTELAGAHGNVAGMRLWRQEVAYVYHLGSFLSINARPTRTLMMVIGIEGRQPFGVLIDSVGEVIDVAADHLHEVPATCKSINAISSVIVTDQGQLISVINAAALFGPGSALLH